MKKSHILTLLVLASLILRFSLMFVGYHGDLNNNISWAEISYEKGLNGFYGSSDANDWPYSAPNQPPLTILTFTGLRFIWEVVFKLILILNRNFRLFPSRFIWFWETSAMTMLIKLPSIICDVGIGLLIYKFLSKNKSTKGRALIVTAFWLFNPITFYNSSIWGQTDSVVNLLGLIAVLALIEKRLVKFSVFMTASFLFKGSLGLFLPILFFVAVKQKHKIQIWFKAALYSLSTIFLTSVWFHPKWDLPVWLVNLYRERILPGEIGYLTANAFNSWWLVDSGKVLDNTHYFGISARLIGFMIITLFMVYILFRIKKGKLSNFKIISLLSLISLVSFLFMTRIHERYLYPFFPYATMLLPRISGFWPLYVIMSVGHLLNLFHLFWVPTFESLRSFYQHSWFPNTLSVINLLSLIYYFRLLRSSKL